MSSPLEALSYLQTALSTGQMQAQLTSNPDGTYSIAVDVGPGAGNLFLPPLVGATGAAGGAQFALTPMPDVYDSPADLPAPGVLTNTAADIGKFWIISMGNGTDEPCTSSGAYIWFGTEFRFLPFGNQGPPGKYPIIQPYIELHGASYTPRISVNDGSDGSAADPYLLTTKLAIPDGPVGPVCPIAQMPDVSTGSFLNGATPPEVGQFLAYTGSTVDYGGDDLPLYAPEFVGTDPLMPYSIPTAAFVAQSGITFESAVTICQFTIPPQQFAYKPVVFGQIQIFEAQLSFQPFLIGVEVRLGNPRTLLSAPTVGAVVAPSGSILFTPGTYLYSVTAVNSTGETTPSTPVSATATTIFNSVVLTWPAVPGASGYNVYRGRATGGTSRLNTFTVAALTFTDTGLPGSFTAPPTTNTAVDDAGTLVARGFGNTGNGTVTLMPHTSDADSPSAAYTSVNITNTSSAPNGKICALGAFNDVGLVPANTGGSGSTLFIDLLNDGLAAIYDYNPAQAEVFVLCVPVTEPTLNPVLGAMHTKLTLSAQSITHTPSITATLSSRGVLRNG